jgi:hypothetical protein
MQITMKAKNLFLDRQEVIAALGRARMKVLGKAGAFIRKRARDSIKSKAPLKPPKWSANRGVRAAQRKAFRAKQAARVAATGRPPFSHTRGLNLRTIFFAFDPGTETVVIGPVRLDKTHGEASRVLELGGTERITRRRRGRTVTMTGHYRPHPFMGPALDAELPNFPALWNNAIRPQ